MARRSVIGDTPLSTLQIDDFIFHIIDKNQQEAQRVDKIIFDSTADTSFFEDHVREAAKGTQFIFMNNDLGNTQKAVYQNLLTSPSNEPCTTAGSFAQISKSIADSFLTQHRGNVNNGILIVARISMMISERRQKFIALLKVDYSKTLRANYRQVNGGENQVTLERIINAISEHKASIQKWALIDPNSHYVWDILAMERHKTKALDSTEQAISIYFKTFLAAQLHKEPKALTKQAPANVMGWATKQPDLPDEEYPFSYKQRAIKYLETVNTFKDDEFITFVVGSNGNDVQKKQLRESLKEYITEKGLYGQEFIPDKDALETVSKKSKIITENGVLIQFEGELSDSNITITDHGNNNHEIVVKTTGFELKS